MRVTVVGTGNMGRAVARRALAGGHHVTVVGTHIAKADDLAEELTGEGPVRGAERAEGDIVVFAVPYTEAPHAVRQHADELGGAVIVDVTNPVDLGTMEPIRVELGSAAAVIADVAPEGAPVVKAFNTTFAGALHAGQVGGQPLDVFIAGDDADAKTKVARLVTDGGMRPIDVGSLERAREMEATAYLHMAAQGPLGGGFATALKVLTP
jgi:predicted dinucleotide-binding enzyme